MEDASTLIGPAEVSDKTRGSLIDYAENGGELRRSSGEERDRFAGRVVEMLQLIVATGEYQYA